LLITEKYQLAVTYNRKGIQTDTVIHTDTVDRIEQADLMKFLMSHGYKKYDLDSENIVYLDMILMTEDSISEAMKTRIINSRGLIIDLRMSRVCYDFGKMLRSLILPKQEVFGWNSTNDYSRPGNYIFEHELKTGMDNPDFYKGKVAILVNETTQSSMEYRAMTYRKAPQSKIIGCTTAGTNGAVSFFYLAGGISVRYTVQGFYYPEWKLYQREGLKIDIPVRPTVDEIREGKDVWVEAAIQYIKGDSFN
jgi:C-terminal processing protease CtpA/Prc